MSRVDWWITVGAAHVEAFADRRIVASVRSDFRRHRVRHWWRRRALVNLREGWPTGAERPADFRRYMVGRFHAFVTLTGSPWRCAVGRWARHKWGWLSVHAGDVGGWSRRRWVAGVVRAGGEADDAFAAIAAMMDHIDGWTVDVTTTTIPDHPGAIAGVVTRSTVVGPVKIASDDPRRSTFNR